MSHEGEYKYDIKGKFSYFLFADAMCASNAQISRNFRKQTQLALQQGRRAVGFICHTLIDEAQQTRPARIPTNEAFQPQLHVDHKACFTSLQNHNPTKQMSASANHIMAR